MSEAAAGSLTLAATRSRRGFTLLEVLLALALVSALLVAFNAFIFSMSELWGVGTEKRLFDQHAIAATRFLQAEIRTAMLPPSVATGTAALTAPEIKSMAGTTDNLLTFTLPAGSRLISWPENRPLPDVVCSLQVRQGEGLFLLWHSSIETKFAEDPPRETLISPLVTEMLYQYYDTNLRTWSTENDLKKDAATGTVEVPQRLQFKFVHEDFNRQTIVSLPTAAEGLPNF